MSFISSGFNSEWEFKTLFSQPYVVFMNQEHPLASKERISIFDLKDEPFVMLEKKNLHKDMTICLDSLQITDFYQI